MADNEIFVPIIGYESMYEISNTGIIKSLDRIIISKDNRKYNIKGKILKRTKSNGYFVVSLHKNNITTSKWIHQLVAEHFVSGYKQGLEVNHKDGNKHNSNAYNLEWVTHSENIQHALNTGLFPSGEDRYNCKLTAIQISEIRVKYIPRKYTIYDLAKEYNVNPKTIHRIVKFESRKIK